jgi:hypothetical protein
MFAKFTPSPPTSVHHIIWNVILTDKLTPLNKELITENKVKHVLAILPNKEDFTELNKEIPEIPFDVMDYGNQHTTKIDFEEYKKYGEKIDKIAKENKTGSDRNVLIFCNSGYQRSIPFIVHYLTTFHKDEIPTIEKAVDLILSNVDKENYMKTKDEVLVNMNKLLVV